MHKIYYIESDKKLKEHSYKKLYSISKYTGFNNVYKLTVNIRLLKLYKLKNRNINKCNYINNLIKKEINLLNKIEEIFFDEKKYNNFIHIIHSTLLK